MNLVDVPLAKAIATLAGKTGLPITYQGDAGNPVNLTMNDVPAWEAVDRLARQAGLTWGAVTPGTNRALVPGKIAPPDRIAYAGPLRLQPTALFDVRSIGLATSATPRREGIYLDMEVMAPPGSRVVRVHAPRLTGVKDGAGKDVELLAVTAGTPLTVPTSLAPLTFRLFVKPEARAHRTLKSLRGVVPLEIAVARRELAVLPDPGKQPLQRAPLTRGGRLGVRSVQRFGTTYRLTVELTHLLGWQFDVRRHRFEWVQPDGKHHLARNTSLSQRLGMRVGTMDDLSLLGGGAGVPWGALAWQSATQRPGANLQGYVDFLLPAGLSTGSKLVLVEIDTKKVEVPFEFLDLPLP